MWVDECKAAGLGPWIKALTPEMFDVVSQNWQADPSKRRGLCGRLADMPGDRGLVYLKQIEWQVRKDPQALVEVGREIARREGEAWGAMGYPHPGTIFPVPEEDVPVGTFFTGATTGKDAYLHHRAFITRCLERGCCLQDIDDVWLILIRSKPSYSAMVLTGIHSANREMANWTDIQFQYLYRLKYQNRPELVFQMAERLIYDRTRRKRVFEIYTAMGRKLKLPLRLDLIERAKRLSVGQVIAGELPRLPSKK